MTRNPFLRRSGVPLVIAMLAALPLLQGCERRGQNEPQTTGPGGSVTVPGTTPGVTPPASSASN